ncbi:diflavin oxidoreductase [Nocardioides sp. SYSU DS0651]|uniref:diflavin oxidoreductase n=1 Tax=Nocardioides sp. SYSU DS0651 TaxID=3415955 RepID=UPI003F4C8104
MPSTADRPPVHVLFGSQTGNAEIIAMDAADAFTAAGFTTKLLGMDEIGAGDLTGMSQVVLVSSTYDDGDMPDNAQDLWDELEVEAPALDHVRYAVLALGDSSYDDFCAAGRHFDEKLAELGGQRVLARVECDLDYEQPSRQWIKATVETFGSIGATGGPVETRVAEVQASDAPAQRWTRRTPYLADLTVATLLSGDGSRKAVHHYEVDLGDSGITYEPGDSLGLVPVNPADLVDGTISALGVRASEPTPSGEGSWTEVLTHQRELRLPGRELVAWVAETSGDVELDHLLSTGDREALDAWLWGRDVLDLLRLVPAENRDAARVLALLGPVQHRSYSISSAPSRSPRTAELLVSCVRYHRDGRDRVGAGTSTLGPAPRSGEGARVAVFLAPNPSFRLPDDDRPVIMVGPGVGVAPFRSFLLERESRAATGRNWLFFGDQHEACDFLYREELTKWTASGLLTELTTAFSRDQDHKVYVQDRLVARGEDVYRWLEEDAHFYVCGDGTAMSHAVEAALVEVVAKHGDRSEAEAWDYVADLKRQRRYSQDVY